MKLHRFIWLPLTVLLALTIGIWASSPPAPREVETATEFSLTQASATVAAITQAPHLAGSTEHARVRDYLVGRFESLGLTTEVQQDFGVRQSPRFDKSISVSPVENIIAI